MNDISDVITLVIVHHSVRFRKATRHKSVIPGNMSHQYIAELQCYPP